MTPLSPIFFMMTCLEKSTVSAHTPETTDSGSPYLLYVRWITLPKHLPLLEIRLKKKKAKFTVKVDVGAVGEPRKPKCVLN